MGDLLTILKSNNLKVQKILIFLFFFSNIIGVYSQRIIKGKVIDEYTETVPDVRIYDVTNQLGRTDFDGNFEINVPKELNKLIFNCLGCERTIISNFR